VSQNQNQSNLTNKTGKNNTINQSELKANAGKKDQNTSKFHQRHVLDFLVTSIKQRKMCACKSQFVLPVIG